FAASTLVDPNHVRGDMVFDPNVINRPFLFYRGSAYLMEIKTYNQMISLELHSGPSTSILCEKI
ncbi:MAG: hypothetical protein MUR19_04690, partial [Paracoccaceae bacterium]|nr:hypothetical protein [Paracoccaceae bacterium]